MQPAVNLQNTSAATQNLSTNLYNWGQQHLDSHFFHLWPQNSAVPRWFVPFLPLEHHWWPRGWTVRENNMRHKRALWVSLQYPWSRLPARDENLTIATLISTSLPCRREHPSFGLSWANVWFGLIWFWSLSRNLVPLPWLLGHCTDSENSDLKAEKNPSSWCKTSQAFSILGVSIHN